MEPDRAYPAAEPNASQPRASVAVGGRRPEATEADATQARTKTASAGVRARLLGRTEAVGIQTVARQMLKVETLPPPQSAYSYHPSEHRVEFQRQALRVSQLV